MVACAYTAYPQKQEVPFDSDQWQLFNGTVEEFMGRTSLTGNAVIKDVEFENGIVEFDIAFDGQRGFAGLNFRVQSQDEYEHFYLRPHKTGLTDAVQYTPVSNGMSSWQLYSNEGYTALADLPYNEWIHVRFEVKGNERRGKRTKSY